jgi:hypothetical protein
MHERKLVEERIGTRVRIKRSGRVGTVEELRRLRGAGPPEPAFKVVMVPGEDSP